MLTNLPELERELSGLAARIAALRETSAPGAALDELEAAEELLRSALAELGRRRGRREGGNQREQKLLRQIFRALPVPVVVMDAGGVVRRINNETARLLGSPAGYLLGRPFPLLVDVSGRAAFRSHLTAVLHGEESATFQTRLAHQGRTHTVRLVLSRLRMPGEPGEMVAAVALPTDVRLPEASGPDRAPDESAVMVAARRHDLLARLTRLLLDEESLREPVALIRAARLFAAETADWVIADVFRDDVLHRAAVIPPASEPVTRLQRAVEGLDPARAPVVSQVLETGGGTVHEMLADDGLLGPGVLRDIRAGSLLSVPIGTGQEILGVLTLVRLRDRPPFGLADLGLLEEAGAQLGLAMRAQRSFQRRSQAADTLQTGVLPRTLPDIPGFETAAIYHPGSEPRAIGGEFYDVFPVRDGWGFVIGSAAGRGEEAASVTAMVRGGLRVVSVREDDPGAALRTVNDALVAQNTGLFVMAAAGFVHGRRVRLASAGHHPAALLLPDGGVRFSEGGGVPLGFEEGAVPATEELTLTAGETLLLYSDGLVGSRDAEGESYGEGRLTEVLTRCAGQPPGIVVKAIEEDHRAFSGDHILDEITMLTLRRSR
ncbi:SpoIIE family protein phosphatase [Microtetraspora sp. AC03309]|uniref:SpoIIE family protein phosphatase n=1 Tax=Microtetraspora sp. AC03309 TaxID=2779376 RepID=UPI001E453579|nr:SpoIIE family protein phosphatase [Microtetraspora sp. AC03309]MCC5580351.1 SpoIIE family protein phosphatase [Microtetraspora sp. AC03309]